MIRKLLPWAVVIFVIYYVVSDPTGAGQTVHSLLGDLGTAGHSLATFMNSVGS